MDVSAALTDEEVAALSDPDRSLQNAGTTFDTLRKARDPDNMRSPAIISTFEESLKLKGKLDELEELVKSQPSTASLSITLNCEYQLYKLNEATPLRNNPFLSHWVEAVQRLEKSLGTGQEHVVDKGKGSKDAITTRRISSARIGLVRTLLQGQDIPRIVVQTPRRLASVDQDASMSARLWIKPYITMLVEEGIYERTSLLENSPTDAAPKKERPTRAQALLQQLEASPDTVIPALTHLPVDLQSLDLLTTLLQNQSLQHLSITASDVIRDYIQHGLRLIERMGQPVSSSTDAEVDGQEDDHMDDGQVGKEAQIRAVKLLLLFVRNLIRKALIPAEDIYFEIQEICVRYVWIKEVREFRTFVEQGPAG